MILCPDWHIPSICQGELQTASHSTPETSTFVPVHWNLHKHRILSFSLILKQQLGAVKIILIIKYSDKHLWKRGNLSQQRSNKSKT